MGWSYGLIKPGLSWRFTSRMAEPRRTQGRTEEKRQSRRGLSSRAGGALSGSVSPELGTELNACEGAVDHGFEFAQIFYFASLGETALGFLGAHPRRSEENTSELQS